MQDLHSMGRCYVCTESVVVSSKVGDKVALTVRCTLCEVESSFFLDEALTTLAEAAEEMPEPQSASCCRGCGEPVILFLKAEGEDAVVAECVACNAQSTFPVEAVLKALLLLENAAKIKIN